MNNIETIAPMEEIVPLIQEVLSKGQNVRIYPKGISMLPMLRQGVDSVVLSPVPEKLGKFDIPLYKRDNGMFVLHRIIAVDGTYTCMGDNQFVAEPNIRHDQIIAVVSSFYRGDKEHSTLGLGYRIYCVIWHYSRPLRRFWRRGLRWIRRRLK